MIYEKKLKKYIYRTKKFWKLKTFSIRHISISLIISQKIRFELGRKIRMNIYNIIGEKWKRKKLLKITNEQWKELGLSGQKLKTIKKIIKKKKVTLDFIKKLKGVGKWTRKALKLYLGHKNIFLIEDFWIRNRFQEILQKKNKTKKDLEHIRKKYYQGIKKSYLSCFLWRIKKSGTQSIINGKKLTRKNFL